MEEATLAQTLQEEDEENWMPDRGHHGLTQKLARQRSPWADPKAGQIGANSGSRAAGLTRTVARSLAHQYPIVGELNKLEDICLSPVFIFNLHPITG